MDKDLKEFLEKQFSQVDERIDKATEGAVHRFQIITEKLDDKIQQIAEGVITLDQKFDRRLDEMNHTMEQRHQDLLSAIKFSYAELDGRIKTLELQLKHLDERVRRLESH